MARFSPFITIAAAALLLTGCGTGKSFSAGSPQMVATPDSVSALLADAADRASNALETLAAVEHARTPAPSLAPVANAPVELRRSISVNWIGPVEQITKTLADRAGYEFQIIGNPPPVPVVISIDAQNKPIIDVLRDIGLQLGLRGDIKVDSSIHIIEVHYPPNTGVGGDS